MKKFIFILFLFFPASVYAQGWQGIDAANVKTDTTAFNNHLSAADDTVQAALETLDELVSGAVSDTAYSTSWNGVTDTAPSKNAVYDKIETLGSSGAPTDADYLVGTINGSLSAEIVVGTAPGGELGGTWGSPTIDTTHSGTAHHDAVTIDTNVDDLFTLTTQAFSYKTQTANTIFSGPITGAAAVPAFRTIVDDDIPNNITITEADTLALVTGRGASTSTALTLSATNLTIGSGAAADQSLTFDSSAATDMVLKWDNANTRGDLNKGLSVAGSGASTFSSDINVQNVIPSTDDTYYLGEIGSPFKAYKALILKDTTDGKHYKITVISGTITATALD